MLLRNLQKGHFYWDTVYSQSPVDKNVLYTAWSEKYLN